MSDPRVLRDREKALEEEFFHKHNEELKQKLRQKESREQLRRALSQIRVEADDTTLEGMLELGIDAETWAAVSLVPLVEVAWADGKVEEKERRAVMTAAEANGLVPGSPSHGLLQDWLQHRPDPRLLETWSGYVRSLCGHISAEERETLRDELLNRARQVAVATGAFLGFGNRVSPAEEAVLAELQKAFKP